MGENILGAGALGAAMSGEGRICFLIGAGSLDTERTKIPAREGDMCIAVDGGYSYCKQLGIEPHLVIGDMDSLEESLQEEFRRLQEEAPGKVKVLRPEKDDTDMLAAIKEGMEAGYRQFCLYGALGGRIAHSIANIQCLSYLRNRGAKGYIVDTHGAMTVIKDESIEFPADAEGYLSLFALGEKAEGVWIAGMKYLLEDAALTNDFPVGISNEFIGEKGRVTVKKGMLLVIAGRKADCRARTGQ